MVVSVGRDVEEVLFDAAELCDFHSHQSAVASSAAQRLWHDVLVHSFPMLPVEPAMPRGS